MEYIPSLDPALHERLRREYEKTLRLDNLYDKRHLISDLIEALKEKKLPDNNQIDHFMNYLVSFLEWKAVKPTKSTKKILKDLKSLVDESKAYFIQRNKDNMLQYFIYHLVIGVKKLEVSNLETPNVKNLKEPTYKLYKSMLELLSLIITSGKFHRLLEEIYKVSKENIDKALPKDKKLPKVEDIKEKVPRALKEADEPHEKPKQSAVKSIPIKDVSEQSKPLSETEKNKEKLKHQIGKTVKDVLPEVEDKPTVRQKHPHQDLPSREGIKDMTKEVGEDVLQKGVETARELLEDIEKSEKKPTEAIKGKYESTKKAMVDIQKGLQSTKLREEQKERLLDRFCEFMRELHSKQKYQKAIASLIHIFDNFPLYLDQVRPEITSKAQALNIRNQELRLATNEAKTLIGNFLGNQPIDPLYESLRRVYSALIGDEKALSLLSDLRKDAVRFLTEPKFVSKDIAKLRFRTHFHNIYGHLDRFYRKMLDEINAVWTGFILKITEDTMLKSIGDDYRKLYLDIFRKKKKAATPKILLNFVKDLMKVIIHKVVNYEFIRLPRIEQKVVKDLYIVDNVILKVPSILSGSFITNVITKVDGSNKLFTNALSISTENINIEANNAAYYVRKKIGPMFYTDDGYVDINTYPRGIKVDLVFSFPDIHLRKYPLRAIKHKQLFKVAKSKVTIYDLKLNFHHGKHSTLNKVLTPLITSIIKPILENVIAKEMKERIDEFAVISTDALHTASDQLISEVSDQWRSNVFNI